MIQFTQADLERMLRDGMPCLSLWEPWGTLIAAGFKAHETRHWPTNVRGWVAIHAAKKVDREGSPEALCDFAFGPGWAKNRPVGCVIAVAYLSGCYHTEDVVRRVRHSDLLSGNYEDGRFAFRLDSVRPLRAAIPLIGRQGFFRWSPPEDLMARLLRPAAHDRAADLWDAHRLPQRLPSVAASAATWAQVLHDFYLGALEAELTKGGDTPFSARMATYYCRWLLALEATHGC